MRTIPPVDRPLAPQVRLPVWVGYAVTLLLEVGLTAGLLALASVFPLGGYPITYVLVIMLVAYLFGAGPAIVAFVSGLLLFDHYFVTPIDEVWPPAHTPEQWARIVAFLLGTLVVLFATLYMRKARIRIEQLATELEKEYEREHHIAESLQASLLGAPPHRLGGFEFETIYHAAMEEARVGGDFYDVFRASDHMIGIVVGDVSGKGLKAAVQVAVAKYSIRAAAYDSASPARILDIANRALVREMNEDSFVTVFVGLLDSNHHTLTYANAGHSPVVRWHSDSGEAELLGSTGLVCGLTEDAHYDEAKLTIEPDDEILMGTDGLYEVRCGDGFLDIDGLLDLYTGLQNSGAKTAVQLVGKVLDVCDGDLRDDLAIVRVSVSR